MTTDKHQRQSRRDNTAKIFTIASSIWILLLGFVEFVIGERNGLAAFLTYLPQHPLGLPVLVSLLVSLIARNSKLVLVNVLLVAVFLYTLMGFNVSLPGKEDDKTIKVMTWNVHGFHVKPNDVLKVVGSQMPDVLCLQEVTPGNLLLQSLEEQGWYVASTAEVAVATRSAHILRNDCILLPGSGRRAQVVTIKAQGRLLDVWSVHFSTNTPGTRNQGRRAYLEGSAKARTIQVAHLLEEAKREKTIIAGDFNLPPRGVAYRRIASNYGNAFSSGNGLGYTYRSDLPVLRIDHIFLSRDIKAVHCNTVRTTASDHLPVVSVVKL